MLVLTFITQFIPEGRAKGAVGAKICEFVKICENVSNLNHWKLTSINDDEDFDSSEINFH